jgi:hypothetical protein
LLGTFPPTSTPSAQILQRHGEILKAIGAQGGAANRRSRRHLFDLYASLVAPAERSRLESLLGWDDRRRGW